MFIDVHAHAYRGRCPPQDGITQFATPEQVLARYDELEIDRGVLLPLIGPEVYLPQSNEDVFDMAEQSGGRFIPFCNVDPRGISKTSSRTGCSSAPTSARRRRSSLSRRF